MQQIRLPGASVRFRWGRHGAERLKSASFVSENQTLAVLQRFPKVNSCRIQYRHLEWLENFPSGDPWARAEVKTMQRLDPAPGLQ